MWRPDYCIGVLKVLKPIWTDKPETASRLRGRIGKVVGWATAMEYRSGENPAGGRRLGSALAAVVVSSEANKRRNPAGVFLRLHPKDQRIPKNDEILDAVAHGEVRSEIAARLEITPNTPRLPWWSASTRLRTA